nr:odorant-binding protein 2 [Podabrus annulatus]
MGIFSQFQLRFFFTSQMKFPTYCALILLFVLLLHHVKSEMTEKQLQSLIKMTRSVCQPKLKVSNELIAAFHQGEFVKDRALMCYMECCLKMAKMIKNGKLDFEPLLEQAKTLPAPRQQPTTTTVHDCKDAGGPDMEKCEAAFEIYKCVYESNPPEFYLA